MTQPVVLAGATGDLGLRLARALVSRGAEVRALVRAGSSAAAREQLTAAGATLVTADLTDMDPVVDACRGASCVVSALSGLREVILDRQSLLLDAAVEAGVPRFISSDYSEDFTTTEPGHNRNLDLRREFMGRADRASIAVTSVLNGAFLDMLGVEIPIIQRRLRRVFHFGDVDQPLNFTSRDDTADYTARVALDESPPRILRIAGDTVSSRALARLATRVTGTEYRTLRAGGVGVLAAIVPVVRFVAPDKPESVFPAWQGMAYMLDMFSGAGTLYGLDNARYPELSWTSVAEHLASGVLSR